VARRGRPRGTTGRAAVLTGAQIKHVFRVARSRRRHTDRAEAVFAMSLGLGLRAKELAALKWADVFDGDGRVRPVIHLKAAYTKGARTRDVFVSSPQVRQVLATYGDRHATVIARHSERPLFPSQRGSHMTASSMARFLKVLYRDAGIPNASSHSGRRTLITGLAERGIDLKAIAEIAGHSSVRTTAIYVESNPTRLAKILQGVRW
jgi:integrase/recombinase XerD